MEYNIEKNQECLNKLQDNHKKINNDKLPQKFLSFSYKNLDHLPIMKYKNEILNLLELEQVIIISGSTGCGKTTQVPKFLLEKLIQLNSDKKILITQPRRIAAMSIAKRLSQELNTRLGQLVGYHVGLNPYFTNESKIIICTTGIILQKLINESSLDEYAYILVDEVHERDVDIDILLVILKHLICKNSNTKLILMSATICIDLFSKYFSKESISSVFIGDMYENLKIGKILI